MPCPLPAPRRETELSAFRWALAAFLFVQPLVSLFGGAAPARANDLQFAFPLGSPPPLVTIPGRVLIRRADPRFERQELKVFLPESKVNRDSVKAGDLNGDGRDDLLAYAAGDSIQVALSDGNGSFREETWRGIPQDVDWSRTVVAKFDANRCADIAGVKRSTPRTVFFAYSDCKGGFTIHEEEILPEVTLFPKAFSSRQFSHIMRSYIVFDEKTEMLHGVLLQSAQKLFHYEFRFPFFRKKLVGYADLNGDGMIEPVERDGKLNVWYSRFLQRVPEVWADIPLGAETGDIDQGLLGDFDGNGSDDILVSRPHPLGWWVVLSGDSYSLERPVLGLPLMKTSSVEGLLLADIDGDHVAEIFDLRSPSGEATITGPLPIHYARFVDGVEGVTVEAYKGATPTARAVTGPSGSFELTVSRLEQSSVKASDARFNFFPPERATLNNYPLAYLSFTAESKNDPRKGRALRLEGRVDGPSICLGFRVPLERAKWGRLVEGTCPPGYSIWGADDSAAVMGDCCKLPAEDILLPEKEMKEGQCAPGFVAVGANNNFGCRHGECSTFPILECQKVNPARYQLGPPLKGVYWSMGPSSSDIQLRRLFRISDQPTILRDSIPIAIRYGMGRAHHNSWDIDGCLGPIFGSQLTKRGDRWCEEFEFQEIQYTGAAGDPPKGTPVKMFPDCHEISGVYDPEAYCVR